MSVFFDNKIEFLKGVGPARGALLREEVQVDTFHDLIHYFPFRHEDRQVIHPINTLHEEMSYVQILGKIIHTYTKGEGAKQRMVAIIEDGTGELELLWFQGIKWATSVIKLHSQYLVYGKLNLFNGKLSITHPELELYNPEEATSKGLEPVYSLTDKLRKRQISSKIISNAIRNLITQGANSITENLPEGVIKSHQLLSKKNALVQIHFPKNLNELALAQKRLKFEELLFLQLRIIQSKQYIQQNHQGFLCKDTSLLKEYYEKHLPFTLTEAQKRVVREIYKDMASGKQMNRLLQGDVGSGKTMVAFLAMLIAISNGLQCCLMAPTEILAEQHYRSIKMYADPLNITIDKLTGSSLNKNRRVLHARLENGNLKILIGTHALIEDKVKFERLGLCIIDEQHRFGVEQRSKLWKKTEGYYPHVLVTTATPIPRTLAMTAFGNLEVSKIDEMPVGRKPIITAHRYEKDRGKVYDFMRSEIEKGYQCYIIYPLVEESEKLDLKNVTDGFENIQKIFKEYKVGMVHGQLSSIDKESAMTEFKKKETQILVATTVIEVGVDVPNASVMIIENAERFGLAQLHQLRGRVGRGSTQSYCILMTDVKLSKESRIRLNKMVETNDGFEIADADMKLRGFGNIMGTEQSGLPHLAIADLTQDFDILQEAQKEASKILQKDPLLKMAEHQKLKEQLALLQNKKGMWSRIS